VTQALSKYDLQFSVPTGTLGVFTIVAAPPASYWLWPARRAAWLNVLQALQYE
jgi:hypothetical protein